MKRYILLFLFFSQPLTTFAYGDSWSQFETAAIDNINELVASVASGMYFARLEAGDFVETVKMTVVK